VFSRDHGKLGPGKVVPLDCKREVNFLLSWFKYLFQLCASSCLGEKTGLCRSSDLGGPLMDYVEDSNSKKQYTLYGITSCLPTYECGIQSLPAVYTNVRAYMRWILDNIRPWILLQF
jgi:hypothetical protein